ncbi:MAG: hypothetical protein JZU58_08710 [Curvibacter lanceolatus]|uniref:hypothetical protein n=1 Tax=Curvibacter lanceolatus TaxID=86182 RepID=UPI002356E70C|nr:hypothetical protein [Curvibacter lanceolatus]MBV5292423.1 hypothetical protein [Curvibacter lanceolatus]
MEQKQLTIDELMKLVSTGKATAMQKIDFAKLLNDSAQVEAQAEKQSKVQLIEDFILKQGLTVKEFISLKKPQPTNEVLFQWTDDKGTVHTKIKGQKGKWSSKDIILKNLTKEKALEIATTTEAKAFINNLYKP